MLGRINTLRTDARGFTLIEVSIALIIVGLIMVPMLQIYKNTLMQRKISDTNTNIGLVYAALGKYVEKNGRYPAPAQPNIPLNQAGSGQALAGNVLLAPPAACAVNSVTVCSAPGTGAIDVDADNDGTPETADFVLIGAIPFATLGIPYQATIDGYGYQFKYAVTASMTNEPTFENNRGIIQVQNDGRLPARPLVYDAGTPQAHFVVVSHGEDARGAFNQSGTVTIACGTVANGLDFENCDNDRVFRSNIFQFEDTPDTTPGVDGEPDGDIQFNRVAGAQMFDDFVASTSSTATGLWSYIPNQSMINTTQQDGGVELGVDPACANASCIPRVRMNVNGNVLVEGDLRTQRLCDVNEPDCNITNAVTMPSGWFTPQVIAGTPNAPGEGDVSWSAARQGNQGAGILCTGDRGLRGINNFDEECQNTVRVGNPTIVGAGCNPSSDGRYPVGINAAGQIICEIP